MAEEPPQIQATTARTSRARVMLYRAIGVACVGLATLGLFLPLMPTTVFLLIALWAFAKGSPEWAERIRAHPRFGPYVRDWEERRAIPVRAKVLAVVMMAASWTILLFTVRNAWVVAGVGVLLLGVAGFIVTRPSA